MSIIEESLDSFIDFSKIQNSAQNLSPTNLSFGQGSPVSRGSLIDGISQNPELGSIDMV